MSTYRLRKCGSSLADLNSSVKCFADYRRTNVVQAAHVQVCTVEEAPAYYSQRCRLIYPSIYLTFPACIVCIGQVQVSHLRTWSSAAAESCAYYICFWCDLFSCNVLVIFDSKSTVFIRDTVSRKLQLSRIRFALERSCACLCKVCKPRNQLPRRSRTGKQLCTRSLITKVPTCWWLLWHQCTVAENDSRSSCCCGPKRFTFATVNGGNPPFR